MTMTMKMAVAITMTMAMAIEIIGFGIIHTFISHVVWGHDTFDHTW